MPSAQTEGRDRFQTWGLEYTGSRGTGTDFEEQTLSRSRGATRGPSERASSPVTQELEACDVSWRNEPRNAPHGCQKPQRSRATKKRCS